MNKPSSTSTREKVEQSLKRRYRAEARFRAYGIISVGIGVFALAALFFEIISTGAGAFRQTYIQLEIDLSSEALGIHNATDENQLFLGNYRKVVNNALMIKLGEPKKRQQKFELYRLMSVGASYKIKEILERDPSKLNTRQTLWLLADDEVDAYYKTRNYRRPTTSRLSERQLDWINHLVTEGQIRALFNREFFTNGDSAEPEQAGILGALLGSVLTLLITMVLSIPIGIAAAIYLEEYAPTNRFTEMIEVNINNLAAVPSVIYGILGLAIFLNFFDMPRSIPLVGGLVLTLMTLPTIIITSRAAIKSVPQSIRDAALGLGASKMQMVVHHILPLALPGMLTGSIIGMAQALGETAPLLMIGMVAFIVELPQSIQDPATVLPVQIFLWADSPERAFVERTSAAIMVLLAFLMAMNGLAIWLRGRFERPSK